MFSLCHGALPLRTTVCKHWLRGFYLSFDINEPLREEINNLVSDQVRSKLACTAMEEG